MSVQKLIAEAEKLLDKKKVPDAIERFKSALGLEPLNQLVSTRLANIYLDMGDRPSAARAYSDLAARLAEAGKNGVAIAFYKQAIEISPDNMELRVIYARECEEMGKIGDAQTQAQAALQHYLRRKKYLDASGVMPLLIRLQGRDDLKAAWIEVIQLGQGEQKLPHLLVALCGPPGMLSAEFNVGGDAAALSEGLYEALKGLVAAFPRDPRVPYAVAWTASRRGRKKDFYENLRECIRREPDFCLAYLLWARMLSEENRLSEALFVFKLLKERLPADRSVDMATLNRFVDAFVEKSPWITTGPSGGAHDLEAPEFINAFIPGAAPPAAPSFTIATPAAIPVPPLPPAQPAPIVAQEGEISFGIVADPSARPAPLAPATAEISVTLEEVNAALNAAPTEPAPAMLVAAEDPAVERADSVEFTNLIKVTPEFQAGGDFAEGDAGLGTEAAGDLDPSSLLLAAAEANEALAASGDATPAPKFTAAPPAAPAATSASGFNPLTVMEQDAASLALEEREEKTEMFSPMDVLGAKDSPRARYADVKTKIIESPAAPVVASNPGLEGMFVEGEATQIFSPIEAISAAGDSRRPAEARAVPPATKITVSSLELSIGGATEEGTMVLTGLGAAASMAPAFEASPAPSSGLPIAAPVEPAPIEAAPMAVAPLEWNAETDQGGATQIVNAKDLLPSDLFAGASHEDNSSEATAVMVPDQGPVMPAAPLVTFQPIPQAAKPAPKPAAPPAEPAPKSAEPSPVFAAAPPAPMPSPEEAEPVDLGDDLLQEPTRAIMMPPKLIASEAESTRHLLQEIRKEVKENKAKEPDADAMLRRAERYIVKQNYYLARKALRLALALGADGERVKARLRDIRKIEMPEGLYHSASHDEPKRERSTEIIERLELEFGINETDEAASGLLNDSVSEQLDRIFRENDARTILDFGVGLHEMGLYAQAEKVFTRITEQYPEHAFDAYYLAAVAKFSRRDYAGAASILKHLCAEVGKTEAEKIQVYYTLGELFERMERPDSSREFFEKVAGLDSNYRNVRHKLEG